MNQVNRVEQTPGRAAAYRAWRFMIKRCTDASSPDWPNYGGRGIRVCDDWWLFETFLEHVGPRPSDLHSIDRIDHDGDYEPGNVRWATRKEQNRNKRNNLRWTFNGETATATEWAERIGMHPDTLRRRVVYCGWSIERALTEPPRPWAPGRKRPEGLSC